MAKINSINNSTGSLTFDPGASGDSVVKLEINTSSKFAIGVDDTDSDSFKISASGVLGTTDTFITDSTGCRIMPLQPATTVVMAVAANSVTGDGSTYTIIWDDEIFDQNSDFNTGTGTWIAPVTGRYRISLCVWLNDVDTTAFTAQNIQIVTSNRTCEGAVCNARSISSNVSGQSSNPLSVLADLDASDTVTTTVTVSGGTKVVDVQTVGASAPRGWLSISLVC